MSVVPTLFAFDNQSRCPLNTVNVLLVEVLILLDKIMNDDHDELEEHLRNRRHHQTNTFFFGEMHFNSDRIHR